MSYHLVCGLEIHTELKTKSKMFCGCKNDPFNAPAPNTYTCPVCLGMPGALPVANAQAIEWTVKLGLLLHCRIHHDSKFDRKNYFYPDLPKAYQISQYDLPFCYDGYVDTEFGRVRINRIHLEEDTAKLTHTTLNGKKVTLIDFNRSSVPLVEIVTEPDITSPEQAKAYAKKIQEAVRTLDIGDADLQKGQMRLEANISLQTDSQKAAGQLPDYKVEVKNINSFNFMAQAIDYEVKRQSALLDQGQTIAQETRGFDSTKSITFLQRTKENAADYRYFPDPDLPVIHLDDAQIEAWRAQLPADRDAHAAAWQTQYGIEPKYAATFLTRASTSAWADQLWAAATAQQVDCNKLANYLVNGKLAYQETAEPQAIVTAFQKATATASTSDDELLALIDQVLTAHPAEVERFKAGDKKLQGFFMGQIMRTAGQKLDAGQVNQLLASRLR